MAKYSDMKLNAGGTRPGTQTKQPHVMVHLKRGMGSKQHLTQGPKQGLTVKHHLGRTAKMGTRKEGC